MKQGSTTLTLTFLSRHLPQESSCRGCGCFFLLSRVLAAGDMVAARSVEGDVRVLDGRAPLPRPDVDEVDAMPSGLDVM